MLIGIDASRVVAAQATGTESYSQHLIRALIDLAPGHRFRLYFNRPPATDPYRSANVEPRTVPLRRLWTHVRLSLEVTRRPPDVLFIPAHVLPILHPRRSVVTVHDLGYLRFPGAHPAAQRLYLDLSTRWNARASVRVIADSQATKDDLIRRYRTPGDKIVVAYPGIDPGLRRVEDARHIQAVKSRYGIDGDYLLYLGTLQPRKNLARLIEAYSRSQAREGRLVIAGKKGWLYDDLFKQVEQSGLTDRVIFPGYVPDDDKAALISGATALVFPSLHEGFGFPVVEAMACGTPVVCSNTSSLPEAAGDAALLVDPLDADAIATAIDRVISDANLRRSLIERGFVQASKFTWRACAQTVLDVLEEMNENESPRWLTGRHPQEGIAVSPVEILGIRVDDVTFDETMDLVAAFIKVRFPRQIATVNSEFIMAAQKDVEFRNVLNSTALNLPDGIGVMWAARRLGHRLRERVAGSDLVELIAQRAAQDGWRLHLLGAAEGVAQTAADVWRSRYPSLNVVGTYGGSPRSEEETSIVERIRAAAPDVLFVAYGAPAQDKWIARNLAQLNVPVCMGVGGALDFVAGVTRRAPRWMRRLGLEWLHRLMRQPWRWRRMLVLPRFVWRVWWRSLSDER